MEGEGDEIGVSMGSPRVVVVGDFCGRREMLARHSTGRSSRTTRSSRLNSQLTCRVEQSGIYL